MPSQVDQEDMVDLLEVLRAKPREERPQSVDEAFANLERMMNYQIESLFKYNY
ncbi:hypothetical protein [Limosilactobacillus fermentum]|uniref:hypothetical protein n=1 Tax=Limosilactobacillus fermentum TaxID=1613 RepID=UPI003F06FA51